MRMSAGFRAPPKFARRTSRVRRSTVALGQAMSTAQRADGACRGLRKAGRDVGTKIVKSEVNASRRGAGSRASSG